VSANALYTVLEIHRRRFEFGGGGGVVAQNPQDLRLERGLSSFDQRHHLTWATCSLRPWAYMVCGGTRLEDQGLHGVDAERQLHGHFRHAADARVSGNLANTGGTAAFGAGRAQATGENINAGNFPYFNENAFALPPPGQYGDAGRDTIPGLFQIGLNGSLNRAFRFGDSRRQLQLRLSPTTR